MPGFYINSKPSEVVLNNRYPDRCIAETLTKSPCTVKRNTLDKFMQDKAFCETDELIYVTEGVLLNLRSLLKQYNVTAINDLVPQMYHADGEAFFSKFVGAFSGALFDKSKSVWIVWTNQVGDKAIYYSVHPDVFAVGSQVNYIIEAFREANKKLTFDEQAAYQMLTFSFMEGNSTYAQEIKRLRGGQYLTYRDGCIELKDYYTLHKHPDRFAGKTEEQIISELDKAFREASEMEYAKDEEYGYKHLSDLSGGLDARMNMWVAHTMKPRHIQFITYCKANYLDEIIAKQLAAYWNDEILVKPLDDVTYLYEIDEIVFMSGGMQVYSAITGGKRMLEQLNLSIFGIEHTGQLNGAIIGSYYSSIGGGKLPTGMYSEKLKHRLTGTIHDEFDDHELYMLYSRGFRGIMNTEQIRSNYTEAYTTTTNPVFMQLCMDIPVEMRINHILYKKWILSKYPEAAKYKWEKTGSYITEGKLIGLLRKIITRGPNKLKRILGKDNHIKTGMNPLDYWISENATIRKFMDEYESHGYKYLPDETSEQLITDMKALYKNGTANEKAMVLTVLSSAKLYFGDQIIWEN